MDREELRALIESDLKKDLHMHTIHSDGDLTPEEVIDMRVSEGYELLSITDHDVIRGTILGAAYAEEAGVKFIHGIEFDSEDPLGDDLHMLGYGFDPQNETFVDTLIGVIEERNERNERFRAALNKRGFQITNEELRLESGGKYVGKPTFAAVLVKRGVLSSINEAFATIFQEPDLKAIKKRTLASKAAIETIHAGGGLAVMAHPMEQRKKGESFDEFRPRLYLIMDRMMEYGVDGIECFHPSAAPWQQEILIDYAKANGLMITRGSDFHSPFRQRDYSRYHRP